MSQSKKVMVIELKNKISLIETTGQITPNQRALLRELVGISQKGASLSTLGLIEAVVSQVMEDKKIVIEEEQSLLLVRNLLKEKTGNLSLIDYAKFLIKNPQINKIVEGYTHKKRARK